MATYFEIIFWGSIGVVAYVYAAYPLIVWAWSKTVADPALRVTRSLSKRMLSRYARFTKIGNAEPAWPTVSLIIAAYKEEDVIMQRLHNAVMADYPADKLEIIVGCDGDEDGTGELVSTFEDPRIHLLQFPRRRGKASVLNDCVPQARGEIVIFSDANTMFDPQAIRRLVRHFQDDNVGGVCGKLVLVDAVTGNNVDGMYWKYENVMKRAEGKLGVLLGFNGAIYAIRRELYEPIPPQTIIDDFLIGMRIHLAEKKVIYDESALAAEETAPHVQAEFHRRARIGAGGFQSLSWLWPLLLPHRGRLAWAFWSHKVLRWMCPLFLALIAISNVLLISDPLYARLLLVQELFYSTAIFGLFFSDGRRYQRYLKVQALFVSVNAALFVGFFRWYRGIKNGTWKRTERTVAAEEQKPIEQPTPAKPPRKKLLSGVTGVARQSQAALAGCRERLPRLTVPRPTVPPVMEPIKAAARIVGRALYSVTKTLLLGAVHVAISVLTTGWKCCRSVKLPKPKRRERPAAPPPVSVEKPATVVAPPQPVKKPAAEPPKKQKPVPVVAKPQPAVAATPRPPVVAKPKPPKVAKPKPPAVAKPKRPSVVLKACKGLLALCTGGIKNIVFGCCAATWSVIAAVGRGVKAGFSTTLTPRRVVVPEPVEITIPPEVIEQRKMEELSQMAEYALFEVQR